MSGKCPQASHPHAVNGLRRSFLKQLAAVGAVPLGLGMNSRLFAGESTSYPSRPLRMVHAFSPGSGTDTTGRILAEGLGRILQQSVVVENKPGASMMIGTSYAAKQPADGHTLVMVTLDSMGLNPFLYKNIAYRTSDFDPITLVGEIPLILFGPPGSPYEAFGDLAKASAGGTVFSNGTWGHGSVGHLVSAMIADQTPLRFQYVPFQGAAPAYQAAMGGHVELAMGSPQAVIQAVRAGKARAYAVGGDTRLEALPDVPTFKELGYPELKAMQWHGLSARAGGDQRIIDTLYAGCDQIFNDPDMSEKVRRVGYTKIDGRPPAAFAQYMAEQTALWGEVVKRAVTPMDG